MNMLTFLRKLHLKYYQIKKHIVLWINIVQGPKTVLIMMLSIKMEIFVLNIKFLNVGILMLLMKGLTIIWHQGMSW